MSNVLTSNTREIFQTEEWLHDEWKGHRNAVADHITMVPYHTIPYRMVRYGVGKFQNRQNIVPTQEPYRFIASFPAISLLRYHSMVVQEGSIGCCGVWYGIEADTIGV
eukprot:scaffold8306_cov171-Amphora_coffeaeformis.AAC.17